MRPGASRGSAEGSRIQRSRTGAAAGRAQSSLERLRDDIERLNAVRRLVSAQRKTVKMSDLNVRLGSRAQRRRCRGVLISHDPGTGRPQPAVHPRAT
jgi:hypothetical protein